MTEGGLGDEFAGPGFGGVGAGYVVKVVFIPAQGDAARAAARAAVKDRGGDVGEAQKGDVALLVGVEGVRLDVSAATQAIPAL